MINKTTELYNKYTVIKNTDAEKYLTKYEKLALENICSLIIKGRKMDGKKSNSYYVCNTDEPYADKVLELILEKDVE